MSNDIRDLLGNLGWLDYVDMKNVSYDRLMLEFLCSLHVDWDGSYGDNKVLIHLKCLTLSIK